MNGSARLHPLKTIIPTGSHVKHSHTGAWFDADMVRSLLIKLAMLGGTLGALMWMGPLTPAREEASRQVPASASIPVSTSTQQLTNSPPTVYNRTDTSNRRRGIPDVSAADLAEKGVPTAIRELSDDAPVVNQDRSRQVDLNQATASDLEALPGIGPKLALRVIEQRRALGRFAKIEDLRQVKGIGRKKFDLLRSHVRVSTTKPVSRHKGTL
ncbi:MAG: protein of unknown function, contains DNA-binding helix-hairpin-helix region [Nitrospira sp.]|jgi:competence protein ComEA|nr:protein of unknown function, contains DNA-binding helix-hairpin-helix region [Nitrospira sp.]